MVSRFDWLVKQTDSGAWAHEIWDTHTGNLIWSGSPHVLQGGAIMCVAKKCLEMNADAHEAGSGGSKGTKGRKGSKKAAGADPVSHAAIASCCSGKKKAPVAV